MKENYNLQSLREHYILKGWVVIKNLIDFSEIQEIKVLIENFIRERVNQPNKPRSINFSDDSKNIKNLNSFHELGDSQEIKKFGNSKKIIEIVKFFLNSDPEYIQSELFAKPAKNGLPSPDHQDNYYWAIEGSNALTVWVALDEANQNNGAIHYYDGSHKFGILDHEASYAKGSSQTIKNQDYLSKFKKTQPNLQPGDALIHNCLVVHGSSANKSDYSRQGWTIQFKDKHAIYDINQRQKYEKSLENQIKIRN